MPELPEVEALRRQLEKEYGGKRIKRVQVKTRKYVRQVHVGPSRVQKKHTTPKELDKRVAGGKIRNVVRKGKYVGFELDNAQYLVFHLGMSGHMVKAAASRPPDKHTHVIVEFTQGTDLRFFDARRFGECFVAGAEEYQAVMGELGLDAVNDPIPWQLFGDLVAERRKKMKALLTDQEFIAGLGNIYSDEILWMAGLGWDRSSDSLTTNETRKLTRAMTEILHEAIKYRGTTLSDGEWRDLYDEPGEHQEHLNVFGREGQPCRRCRTPIRRIKINQRSHFFCPQCQSIRVARPTTKKKTTTKKTTRPKSKPKAKPAAKRTSVSSAKKTGKASSERKKAAPKKAAPKAKKASSKKAAPKAKKTSKAKKAAAKKGSSKAKKTSSKKTSSKKTSSSKDTKSSAKAKKATKKGASKNQPSAKTRKSKASSKKKTSPKKRSSRSKKR